MSEQTDLLVIEKLELVPFFTKGDGIDSVLEQIAKEARSIVHDVSTAKGRDAVKAHVTKVTKSKTYLEAQGKALAAEYKEIPKRIDSNRRAVWDFLDSLQKEVRQPLTDWEDEQAKIKAEEDARLEAEENQRAIDSDYEVALLLMERDINLRKEAAEKAEAERIAYEERLKREAVEQAIADAKLLAEQVAAKAIQDKQYAIDEAARLEAARIAQEAKYKQDAIDAENRRLADIKAAKQAEIDRQEAERIRIEREEAAREANIEHKRTINNEILADLTDNGISEDDAKKVISLMAKGLVRNVKVMY